MKSLRTINLSTFLRITGVVILLTAGASFLLEGWQSLAAFEKYGVFLLFNMALAGAGLFCLYRLKDDKGARTFLGMGAASLAVHFTQMGSILYTLFTPAAAVIPQFFTWDSGDITRLTFLAITGIVICIPMSYLGFASYCRERAVGLTVTLGVLSSLLLYPSREGFVTALILIAATGILVFFERRFLSSSIRMKTSDGILVRGILAIPVFILIGRQMLYVISPFFEAVLFVLLGYLLLEQIQKYSISPKVINVSQFFSIPSFLWAWLCLTESMEVVIPQDWIYLRLFTYLPMAAIVFVVSFRIHEYSHRYRILASYMALVLTAFCLPGSPRLINSFILISMGVLLSAFGFGLKEKNPVVCGVICMVGGLAYHLRYAIDFCWQWPWLSLGVLGFIVILVSSYLEKHSSIFIKKIQLIQTRIKEWK